MIAQARNRAKDSSVIYFQSVTVHWMSVGWIQRVFLDTVRNCEVDIWNSLPHFLGKRLLRVAERVSILCVISFCIPLTLKIGSSTISFPEERKTGSH